MTNERLREIEVATLASLNGRHAQISLSHGRWLTIQPGVNTIIHELLSHIWLLDAKKDSQ